MPSCHDCIWLQLKRKRGSLHSISTEASVGLGQPEGAKSFECLVCLNNGLFRTKCSLYVASHLGCEPTNLFRKLTIIKVYFKVKEESLLQLTNFHMHVVSEKEIKIVIYYIIKQLEWDVWVLIKCTVFFFLFLP